MNLPNDVARCDRLGSKEIDRIAKRVLDSADECAPNSNFIIKGWDRLTALCVIQALVAVLEDEGLLVKRSPEFIDGKCPERMTEE